MQKSQDAGNKTPSILILKFKYFIKLFNFTGVGKYSLVCKVYILCFRLIIYVLYSFSRTFATFVVYRVAFRPACGMVDLLFICTV